MDKTLIVGLKKEIFMKLPHPIQYQGSKRNLAPIILKYFPAKVERVVEPFAGTAAISIASAYRGFASKYLLNDYNKSLIQLLELIVKKPKEIADFYNSLWNEQHNNSINHYYLVREKFNKSNDPRLLLYLLSRCVKGSIRYNSEGYFNQSPDKRRKGARPDNMKENIYGVSFLLKGKTTFMCLDYKELLPYIKESDLVYMDPPYQGVCGDKDQRYCSSIDYNEFILFLDELNKKKVPFLISYDGKCGNKSYGNYLPNELNLSRIEIEAGRSTQATLLGKKDVTYESLYLSESLLYLIKKIPKNYKKPAVKQIPLFLGKSEYA